MLFIGGALSLMYITYGGILEYLFFGLQNNERQPTNSITQQSRITIISLEDFLDDLIIRRLESLSAERLSRKSRRQSSTTFYTRPENSEKKIRGRYSRLRQSGYRYEK